MNFNEDMIRHWGQDDNNEEVNIFSILLADFLLELGFGNSDLDCWGCGILSGGVFNFNVHNSYPSSHLRIWKFENVG